MRRLVAAIALALAGGLVGLGAAEVAVRASGAGRQFVTPDSEIGYRLTPDFSRTLQAFGSSDPGLRLATNNLGLRRDGDTTIAKPEGTTRVLVLGDSQTEGIVENADTFAAVLETRLAARGGAKVEVLNGGVSGYSPLLEYLWLREWGARLAPDVVVLVLYTGNDIGELTARETNFAGFGPRLDLATMTPDGDRWTIQPPGAPSRLAMADVRLRSWSRAYEMVRSRMGGGQSAGVEVIGRVAQVCPGCLQALWQVWLAQERPDDYETALLELGALLDLVRASTAEIGARLVVAVLPTKLDVEPQTVGESAAGAARMLGLRSPPEGATQSTRARMVAECESRGIEVHDLQPALRQARAESGRELYWGFDWHLNPEGNRVVARALEGPVRAHVPQSQ